MEKTSLRSLRHTTTGSLSFWRPSARPPLKAGRCERTTNKFACQEGKPHGQRPDPCSARSRLGRYRRSEADDHLSGVLTAQHPKERVDRLVDAVGERLTRLQPAVAQPLRREAGVLAGQVVVVTDEETLDAAPGLDETRQVARPRRRLGVVVDRDHPADGDATAEPQRAHRGLEVLATDVVEVDVDAVGRRLAQLL